MSRPRVRAPKSPGAVPLCALFAGSGATGLAFETLWFHQAGLALGNSVHASSLVLAGFMGGLALGNGLSARIGDRLRDPVRVFAGLELAVAVTGVVLVFGLPGLAPVFGRWIAPQEALPAVQHALRFAAALALLLIPSTAMGATLPLLTRALAGGGYGSALGRLYGWNTLGAVAGAAIVEGVAIGALGIRGSALATGGAGLGVAAGALWLSRRIPIAPASAPATSAEVATRGAGHRWLAAAFATGFALLALEVVWFRFLALFVVAHAEAFAWMLCTVLAGIGVGGLLGARLAARAGGAAAPALALAAAAACALSYATFPLVLARFGTAPLAGAIEILALCVPLMAPTALCSGAFFPVAGAALREAHTADAGATGRLALANTSGSALGALAGAFVLLPLLGMERSLFALAASLAAVGAALAWRAENARGRRAAVAAGIVCAAGLALFPFGALRERLLTRSLAPYTPEEQVVRVREGVLETVVWLEESLLEAPLAHRLVTNAFSMSSTDVFSRRYMKLYVYLPVALHPKLERALLISYGVGSTAKALVATRSIRHIDVVDVSQAILETGDVVFPDPSTSPLADPRVQVHVEDGRWFLATTDAQWDLITGEPPPPQIAGVVHLYTREYFELVHARLAPGGMATYWLPLHSLSDVAARGIVRAFCDVFEDCSLWRGMSFDFMLVGTRGARGPVPEARFTAQWRDPEVRTELLALGFERPEQLGALFVADADALSAYTRNVAPLVDDRPKTITAPPSSLEAQHRLYASWFDPIAARTRFATSPWIAGLWPARLRAAARDWFELQHLLDTFGPGIRTGAWSERLGDLGAVWQRTDVRTPVLWLLGSDADAQAIVAAAPPGLRATGTAQLHIAAGHLADRNAAAALEALARASEDPVTRRRAVPIRLFVLCLEGRFAEARALAATERDVLGDGPAARDFWAFLRDAFGVVRPGPA